MCRVDKELFSSDAPFIVGMLSETFKKVKYIFSAMVAIFDVDVGEIYKNSKFSLQANEHETEISPNVVIK